MSCGEQKFEIIMNGWNIYVLQVVKLGAVLNVFISDKHRKNVSLNEGGKQESTLRGARKNYNPQGRWHAEGREINAKHMSNAGHSL